MSKRWYLFVFIILFASGAIIFLQLREPKKIPAEPAEPFFAWANSVFPDELAVTHHATSMDQAVFDDYYALAPTVVPVSSVPITSPAVGEKVASADKKSDVAFSAVVPHHLVAGKYTASFFEQLKKQRLTGNSHSAPPPVVVIIGPNHPQAGNNSVVTGNFAWRTAYGTLQTAEAIISRLTSRQLAVVDEKIIDTEHTIGAVVPFVKHTWPETLLVPIILKDKTPTSTLAALARELADSLPPGSLVIASVDFSHYLPQYVSDFHDQLSINILQTGNIAELPKAEIDSYPSLYFLLTYNHLKQAEQFHLIAHTNSATILGNTALAETTSHVIGYYSAGALHDYSLQTTDQTTSDYSNQITNVQPKTAAQPLITLQFFGDIMLDRNVARHMGPRGLDYILEKLRGQQNRFFRGQDILMANLEGPFAPTRVPTTKSIAFRFDPLFAQQLKQTNFSLFTLANNHAYDMGQKNTTFTRQTLTKQGLGYCGDELDEGPAFNLLAINKKSESANSASPVSTFIVPGLAEPVAFVCLHNTYHNLDLKKVAAAMAQARQQARYVIVNVHWGEEYRRESSPKQRTLAHWLVEHGATAVIGHHPHVVEETEVYHNRPIFYSLGNFIFDQYFSKDTQEGLSVGLTLGNGQVKASYYFPFYGDKSQLQLMDPERRAEFLQWMGSNSRLEGRKLENGVLSF